MALTLLSAALFALSFPATSWLPLAWIGLAPLLVALRAGSWRRALLLTWLWCLAAFALCGDWLVGSTAHYFHQPLPVALAVFFGVITLMALPYYAAFTVAWRLLSRRYRRALPLLAGAAWVAAELARGRLFTGTPFFIGNPWGLLGYSHADILPLVQVASLTGIYGVSFMLACSNAALAELAMALHAREGLREALLGVASALAIAAGVAIHGGVVLRGAAPEPGVSTVPVAVIQGNADVGSRWRSDAYGENLDLYLRLTDAAVRRDAPRIVFWPEAALTFFLEEEPLYHRAIAAGLAGADLQLVTGGPRADGQGPDAYTNSVFVVEPDGAIGGRYDKEYLVPFAEYFPVGVDLLRRRFGRIRTFQPGTQREPVPTRAGPAGILICNETMLPEAARERVARGATYLVNPSNDSWITDPKYVEQQLDIAQLRAVEQRRWLVRASTAGPSALVDPWGRVTARTDPLLPAVLVGQIRPRSARTPYARWGDAFGQGCAAVTGLALLGAWRRPRLPGGGGP